MGSKIYEKLSFGRPWAGNLVFGSFLEVLEKCWNLRDFWSGKKRSNKLKKIWFWDFGAKWTVYRRSVRGGLKLQIDELEFLSSTPGPASWGGGFIAQARIPPGQHNDGAFSLLGDADLKQQSHTPKQFNHSKQMDQNQQIARSVRKNEPNQPSSPIPFQQKTKSANRWDKSYLIICVKCCSLFSLS